MKMAFLGIALMVEVLTGQVRDQSGGGLSAGNLPIQKVGPDDLIAVTVYDTPEMTRTVRVGADGFIRLPMLQPRIRAAGLMPADLEKAIGEAIESAGLIVEPFVTVNVAEYASRPISVMGAVHKPLTFQANSPVTLLDALARAEGLTQDAGSEILLTVPAPGGEDSAAAHVEHIAVKSLINGADPRANLRLMGGEEVRVPEGGRFFVVGNVKKPGAFSMQDEGETTLLKALAQAEGLTQYAAREAYVYRRAPSGAKQEIRIELKQVLDRKTADVTLLPNDILYVPDAHGRRATLAVLERAVILGSGAANALIYAGVR
jgi:polysaccharide biosynthesis/export protein